MGSDTSTLVCISFLVFVVAVSPAQTFTKLLDFDGPHGAGPSNMSLMQAQDGKLYGTTAGGGRNYLGTVFQITPNGIFKSLFSFNGDNGREPLGSLLQARDGSFYGTTVVGGIPNGCPAGCGTLFRVTLSGKRTGHNFLGPDGLYPYAGLVQGTDGNLYGTTYGGGGSQNCFQGCGTVYKITPDGVLQTIYNFENDTVGHPEGALVEGRDGNFYGTTFGGNPGGIVFKIRSDGVLTTLHDFCSQPKCTDGVGPQAGLVQGNDGDFYGTALSGEFGSGIIFKITPKGKFTILYDFCSQTGCPDGAGVFAGLIQATDGNFYGGSVNGGAHNFGTAFKISPDGMLTTLHSFDNSDGWKVLGGLIQHTNGSLYGTTFDGGVYQGGTVFRLDMGLGPFVAFVRDSGKVGSSGGILGQGFTGTTGVSLNGTPASFKVFADTFLKAKVPTGATTGFVTVTTPSGTLTSNRVFRVTPQLLSFDPPSGPVGTQVTITGVSLTQTEGVGFGNRVPAQFTVNSDTQVTATVPAGAKTGRIGIETKGGTAISAGTFTVTP